MAETANLGLYGLGTMGSALALNILDNGFALSVSNRSEDVTRDFVTEAGDLAEKLTAYDTIEEMLKGMASPRAVIVMVPAAVIDSVIEAMTPHLDKGDTVIDAGNTDYTETIRRTKEMEERGLNFIGMGVSGGEDGARNGPSIMVGGTPEAWEGMRGVIEAIAADFEGSPCAAHLGPDGAGHFVKTVHNGIEYADMELIAELYGLMRYGNGMAPAEIGEKFTAWNEGRLASFLVEITGKILGYEWDGKPAVDRILDSAGQKGTGRWTVIEAVKLGSHASAIEAAVGGRVLSALKDERQTGAEVLGRQRDAVDLDYGIYERAFLAARIIAYAQGFDILAAASEENDWDLGHARIAEIWRAGCIIRSALLDDISEAFRGDLPHGRLLFAPSFTDTLHEGTAAMRTLVCAATGAGHPVPAFSAALSWYDGFRQARGTADLIQAQRDFFGRHGFVDLDGNEGQHGPWWG
ncbi:NADP-dependent phosphogluconate dehydrogenase [Aestuariibius sp. 2305UL40-4]|uniref:NADP-dependent phosphogluconate dehydrogenase n=1 Tax=Aestuariibius violaceus TaxID=3234132 RepID=UPI00345E8598